MKDSPRNRRVVVSECQHVRKRLRLGRAAVFSYAPERRFAIRSQHDRAPNRHGTARNETAAAPTPATIADAAL